jgi:hypothetical protein
MWSWDRARVVWMQCSNLLHAAVLHGLGQMPQLLGGVTGGPAGPRGGRGRQ